MRYKHPVLFIVLLIAILISFPILPGCSKQNALSSKPVVFVSILPQKYFVDKIANGLVEVAVMVEPVAHHRIPTNPNHFK